MWFLMRAGAGDLYAGLCKWRVFLALATEDINDQHKRTTLGPLWLMINYLAIAATFILIFGRGSEVENYPSYVAIGLFVWLFLSETVTQSVSLFVREESFIKGTPLPLSVYILRLTTQSIIRAAYMLIGCVAILLLSGTALSTGWLVALFGLMLVALALPAVISVFAMIGAFFPDSQFLVGNAMRLGMFLTPIFWAAGSGDGIRDNLARWNPFSYYLDAVRIPVMSGQLPVQSWLFCAVLSAGLWLCALWLLGRYRNRVVFVL